MFSKKDLGSRKKTFPGLPLSIFENSRKPQRKAKKNRANVPYIHEDPEADVFINVKKFKPSKPAADQSEFEHLDKLLLVLDHETIAEAITELKTDAFPENISGLSNESKFLPPSLKDSTSLASLILGQDASLAQADATREKYKNQDFPLPKSKRDLKHRTKRLLGIVPRLLAGEEDLSIFYTFAHNQSRNLPHVTMSPAESFDLPWLQYTAGFYGLRRQNFVSQLIEAEHGELLRKSRNKTVVYWSPDMFCTYVLAPEIILRLVMEDMALSRDEAESLLRQTADFGSHVADGVELVDDLDFDELEILTRGISEPKKSGPHET
ncbi:hypothetical protein METBIDRAFT_10206 [Metschnikowia bicuspidata var. bicuspidata NRRL YB-4993]|uniref:Restriction of telomere capping protein 4 n=1 Tax=Metschnikowia bicuspidata var. bicuspidata NRRL YB-4993 TaxID=869754 RepID=A0A1A0HJK0_9ASCO|nr:hypothetical protein METBIDRAFT_10206 [Metschnikowia bicuspidata var. bicuspidata NRRL YB-4993]OBA24013.1 hypothetical protein METBIDRAFT_10206 [Metschnikowia bicuspidata var. bicuspidata NRRL YB-4993]